MAQEIPEIQAPHHPRHLPNVPHQERPGGLPPALRPVRAIQKGTCVCQSPTHPPPTHLSTHPCKKCGHKHSPTHPPTQKVCAGCNEPKHIVNQTGAASSLDIEAQRELLEREIKGLHLRKQRKILRDFDKSNGLMDVKAAVAKAQAEEEEEEDDDWGSDDEEEEEEEEGGGGEGEVRPFDDELSSEEEEGGN